MRRAPARSQLLSLYSANVLRTVSNAAAAVIATIALGPYDRGLMVLGLTVGSIMSLVGGLGTGTAFRSILPNRQGAERAALTRAYTWCLLMASVPTIGTAVLLSAGSAAVVDGALAGTAFLMAVGLYTFAQLTLGQLTEAWYADGQFRRGGAGGSLMCLGGLAGVAVAVAVSDSAAVVLAAQGAGVLAVAAREARALWRAGLICLGRPAPAEMGTLVRVGVPALGLTVGLTIALRADRFVLGVAAGPAAVGIYSLAATLAEIPRVLPIAVSQIYMRESALGRGAAALRRTVRVAVAGAVAGGAVVAAGSWALIAPIFGEEFVAAREILLVLLVAEVCIAPHVVASLGLLGGAWSRTAGTIGAVGAAGALACFGLAAAAAGALGLAYACVAVYAGLSYASWTALRSRLMGAAQREVCRV